MIKNWKTKETDALFKTILSLKSKAEAENFFRDLCTLEEIQALRERWLVARILDQGKSYRDIAKETGISTTTITRVAHWLHHGEGGYKLILKRTNL
jgi:TrpR-related protein YerC/YecD